MKKNKSNIILATAMLGVVSVVATYHASAITYQNSTNVEFTFNPTINVSLSSSDLTISNLAPGSTSDSNVITATVSTNAGYGYYLSATTGTAGGNTNLTNTADSTYNFASLSSNATTLSAIPDNKWGYSYSTDNGNTWISGDNGSALAGYNGLPLDADDSGATGVKLLSSDSFAGTGSVQFKIGARASSDQASGTYTGTVNFYAVTNPAPVTFNDAYAAAGKEKLLGYYKMQDITTDICNAVDDMQAGMLIDVRDNSTYTVAKLQGACWMTQNLRITGTVNAQYSNFSTYGNVDVCEGDLTSGSSYDEPRCHDSENTSNGVWYNYAAASAKTILTSSNTNEATEDICPAGWHLPNYDDTKPAGSVNSLAGISSVGVTAFQPVTGGYYYGGSINAPGNGYWWSSTAVNSGYRYYLYYNGSSLDTSYNSRYYGMYIRCVR